MSIGQPYSGRLKAVIFDWAGTTVDYGCFAPVAVFVEVFARQGIAISTAQARAPMGLEKRDHIRAVAQMPEIDAAWRAAHGRSPNEDDIDRMYRDSVVIQTQTVTQHADLIPGALETVQRCRARGIRIGSSTGYSRAVMAALLPAAAAQGYQPDAVVCPDDVPGGRPAPWMMYQNAIQLGVYPFAAVVKVGDTIPDIEEGLNAGAWTVAVAQTGSELGLSAAEVAALSPAELDARLAPIEDKFRRAGAHYIIRTIADLPPILDQIEGRLHS
jgi:phosphonoacetaldehyde hydrolase